MAVTVEDFSILTAALDATRLDQVLPALGPVTVFAPTDDAFIDFAQALGADIEDDDEEGALNAILATVDAASPGDGLGLLAGILVYHVAGGTQLLADVAAAGEVESLLGLTIEVAGLTLVDEEPDIADPALIPDSVDIQIGPITVHAIDGVLVPLDVPGNEPTSTIAEIALELSSDGGFDDNPGDFDILLAALRVTGLDEVAADPAQNISVFAPTDAAFIQLVQDLGLPIGDDDEAIAFAAIAAFAEFFGNGVDSIADLLLYHIAGGDDTLAQRQAAGTVETLQGESFVIDGDELVDGRDEFDNPEFIGEATDIQASNGVIHAIDAVLLPPLPDDLVFA